MGATVNLTHHFLIAMPSMADPNFAHTLTFVCEHNPEGALGLALPGAPMTAEMGGQPLSVMELGPGLYRLNIEVNRSATVRVEW